MTKLVLLAHGTGDHEKDFHEEWEEVIRKNHPGRFDVAGLWWDDVLDRVADRFPLVSERFADVVGKSGLPQLKKTLSSDAYGVLSEHFMDVLVYTGLQEMTYYIMARCALKLKVACGARAADTVLVGHSLGNAMLQHIVCMEQEETGSIPYHGLIMCSPTLGVVSPIPSAIEDLLGVTPGLEGKSRAETLRSISRMWRSVGPERLHLIINERDPICWDTEVKIGSAKKDLIPIRQGFSTREINALRRYNPNCVKKFAKGSVTPARVVGNHAMLKYLETDQFNDALELLLA